jgi:hypothetical protein
MRQKEPTLFRVKLLTNCVYNDEGDRLNIKMVDKDGNIYYYDSVLRWTILPKSEEHISWERIYGKNDVEISTLQIVS